MNNNILHRLRFFKFSRRRYFANDAHQEALRRRGYVRRRSRNSPPPRLIVTLDPGETPNVLDLDIFLSLTWMTWVIRFGRSKTAICPAKPACEVG